MPVTQTFIIRTPIPPSIPPATVLAHLHQHGPVFRANDSITAWDAIPVPYASIANDPFFLPDADSIAAYRVRESIPIFGSVSAPIRFPAVFQNGPTGMRVRVDAPGGVRVWTQYIVRKRGSGPLGDKAHGGGEETWSDGEDDAADSRGWEMVEILKMQGPRLFMPFATGQAKKAHQDGSRKFMEQLVDEGRDSAQVMEGRDI
ncbi:hypothetical protein D7B24_000100 [Verticillium nonalfalfae]|uniref:DUF7053 domain-containing protein n=1 Tax=Verticillium nonalfalfae TaxID=1051616 RepID=A0A3M9YNB2_9PEZI|nr:uncharacterized protein D7B24_000100 [Verticillium nonalfalfae]RNJ61246.1 hypothetical protein D7B24_000100 [Verticillium nonalfalfae]